MTSDIRGHEAFLEITFDLDVFQASNKQQCFNCSNRLKGRLIYNITHLGQVMTLTEGQIVSYYFFLIMYHSAIS